MSERRHHNTGSTAAGITNTLDADRNGASHRGTGVAGTATGAAVGTAVGAAVGMKVGGPGIGTLVGAAVGAIAGGLVGHGVAEAINPTEEDAYWRENYKTRPYAESNRGYEHYQPAYKYGWESRERYVGKTWDQADNDLERGWDKAKGASGLTWNEAKHATRDAWHRVEGALPGDLDRGGRSGSDTTGGYTIGGTATGTTGTLRETNGTILSSHTHEDYRPAYWYGWEATQRFSARRWEEVAEELERGWGQAKGRSRLSWSEAETAVREAWDQASALQARPRSSSPVIPLQQLHDPVTGRLDAGRVADYLSLPLKQLSEALGRNYSTIHRTPAAPALQDPLRSIKRSLEILERVLGNRASVLAWWNSPHPDLGRRTPMEVLLEGRVQIIEDMLEAALEGIPS